MTLREFLRRQSPGTWPFVGAFALVGLLAFSTPDRVERVDAQVVAPQMDAFDYEALTVAGTAVRFTLATVSPANGPSAKAADCSVESNSIRYRYDGSTSASGPNPTSSEGHVIAANERFMVIGTNNVLRWRGIQVSGAATLRCTFLR